MFVAVNLLLFMIWLTTWQLADGTSYPWFLGRCSAGAVGLAAHYAAVRDHLPASRPRPQQPPTASKADELARLAELHRDGSLSDEEFTAAKAALLHGP